MNNSKVINQNIFSIYLAEDDMEDQEIFKDALAELETIVNLTLFSNGQELIMALQSQPQRPDMIFLDLYMPKMDGEECLNIIRNNESLDNIPIVIYSNEYNLDRIEKLFSLGANRYLRKPDSYSSLVASLDKTVNSVKRNALGGTAIININV
ncbi:response regulator [Arenibacter sp. BSSL-BM3]|uniref:Response regulator n=1 Tax=Arenibacter arenosicollis TaxID=2762274 RepID=A0ABR7QTV7_9FLAO|nr:response regulator [Arenibacter arenosicollis]MBC8770588.1 response regulator [Arenibacter arenosicollis]